MSAPRALVIVPTYNERENLPILAGGLMQHPGVRLLIVDDQSPDGTGAIADDLARQNPGRVEVMHRSGRAASADRMSTASGPRCDRNATSSARWMPTCRTIRYSCPR